VEKNVRDARHRLLQDAPPFDGFAELTERVSPNCLVAFEQASFRGLAVSTVLGALQGGKRIILELRGAPSGDFRS